MSFALLSAIAKQPASSNPEKCAYDSKQRALYEADLAQQQAQQQRKELARREKGVQEAEIKLAAAAKQRAEEQDAHQRMLAKTEAEAAARIQEEWERIESGRQELLQAQKANQDELAVLEAKSAKQAAMTAEIQRCREELEKRSSRAAEKSKKQLDAQLQELKKSEEFVAAEMTRLLQVDVQQQSDRAELDKRLIEFERRQAAMEQKERAIINAELGSPFELQTKKKAGKKRRVVNVEPAPKPKPAPPETQPAPKARQQQKPDSHVAANAVEITFVHAKQSPGVKSGANGGLGVLMEGKQSV